MMIISFSVILTPVGMSDPPIMAKFRHDKNQCLSD